MKYIEYQTQEHDFAKFVRILGKGKRGTRSLTRDESEEAFRMILNGDVLPEQLGAFLMLLRVKEESVDELVGFVSAVKESIKQHKQTSNVSVDLDWPSYAGKKKHHAWFLLCAMTLAKHGVKVCMHGVAGHTLNRVYSEPLLKAMGYEVVTSFAQVTLALKRDHLCYLPMRVMQPTLSEIIQMRNVMGLRSPVHTLARLINPFDAPFSMQSIFHPPYQKSHLWSAYGLGYKNTAVIKGDGGEFECNPSTRTKLMGFRDGSPYEIRLPRLSQSRQTAETDLSVEKLQSVWLGQEPLTAYANQAIELTLATTLITMKKAHSVAQARELAKALWNSRHD